MNVKKEINICQKYHYHGIAIGPRIEKDGHAAKFQVLPPEDGGHTHTRPLTSLYLEGEGGSQGRI